MAPKKANKNEKGSTAAVHQPSMMASFSLSSKHFQNGKYLESLAVLKKIQDSSSIPISHNLAILRFCTDKKTITQTVSTLEKIILMDSDEIIKWPTLVYNYCLILYSQKQFLKAFNVLEKFYKQIDALRFDQLALISFLFLDVCISIPRVDQAEHIISRLENALNSNGSETEPVYLQYFSIYKAHFFILTGKLQLCKREIKAHLNACNEISAVVFVKGSHEFLRKNYKKSTKLLQSCQSLKGDPALALMYFNNLALCFIQMKKHNMAHYYFNKAFELYNEISKRNTRSAHEISNKDYRHVLFYNSGIQLLHAGQPQKAFSLFKSALIMHSNKPHIWLRLCECCVAHYMQLESKKKEGKSSVIQESAGVGENRCVDIGLGSSIFSNDNEGSCEELNLEYALTCARNVVSLFNRLTNSYDLEAPKLKNLSLKHYLLAANTNIAFISIVLGDYRTALSHAEMVISSEMKEANTFMFVAYLYKVECLVKLWRVNDAIQLLQPSELPFEMAFQDSSKNYVEEDGTDVQNMKNSLLYYPKTHVKTFYTNTRLTLLYNLVVVFCTASDYKKARQCLSNLSTALPNNESIPPEVILLGVFLELKAGEVDSALKILKEYSFMGKF